MKNLILIGILFITVLFNCKKDEVDCSTLPEDSTLKLNIWLEFDSTLPRLGNLGQPVSIPAGNAAQNPKMNEASLHYIEFAKDSLTPLTNGSIVYQGEETSVGGTRAVDFDKAIIKSNNRNFVSMDLSKLAPGTYNWLRVSLTYQNYDVDMIYNNSPLFVDAPFTGTLASFVGFNNYITSFKIKDSTVTVNQNKLQGYWAFESRILYAGNSYGIVNQGDSSDVTVVNPINSSSPVPAGSCIVTGKLAQPLVITGDENNSKFIVLAFSINNSFEWKEVRMDGKFEPGAGEKVVDMGLRGLHPYEIFVIE